MFFRNLEGDVERGADGGACLLKVQKDVKMTRARNTIKSHCNKPHRREKLQRVAAPALGRSNRETEWKAGFYRVSWGGARFRGGGAGGILSSGIGGFSNQEVKMCF